MIPVRVFLSISGFVPDDHLCSALYCKPVFSTEDHSFAIHKDYLHNYSKIDQP